MRELKLTQGIVTKQRGSIVSTVAAVMGNVDLGRDRILNGAFTESLASNKDSLLGLWGHDTSIPPISVVKDAYETPVVPAQVRKLAPDATGVLMIEHEFIKSNPTAAAVLAAIEAGSPLGASIGYDPAEMFFTNEAGEQIRNLKQIRLLEVSIVNFGMNPAALAQAKGYRYAGGIGTSAPASLPALHLKLARLQLSMLQDARQDATLDTLRQKLQRLERGL